MLTPGGQWLRPIALGILDDHSRLCCHVQWYLSETAEDLVHGLSQAIQKRGLPRALLTDNGSAMVAEEVTEGLLRLGIVHERTLPYSPYQNGKQEAFWGTLEGRLDEDARRRRRADARRCSTKRPRRGWRSSTTARCTARPPARRSSGSPTRPTCSARALRASRFATRFAWKPQRTQRQSDGTISLEGVRFEIPARYRHFRELTVRYARWNLGRVDLVDASQRNHSGSDLSARQDRQRRRPPRRWSQPDGRRRAAGEPAAHATASCHRFLKQILQEYSATGLPPAYLPKTPPSPTGDAS